MAAARNGRAMKMRRSTPIFQTVRQASPSDGGVSTDMSAGASGVGLATSSRGAGSPRSDASICSLSSSCS